MLELNNFKLQLKKNKSQVTFIASFIQFELEIYKKTIKNK